MDAGYPCWRLYLSSCLTGLPNDQRTGTRQPQAGVPSFVWIYDEGFDACCRSKRKEGTQAVSLCLTGLASIAKLLDYL